MTPNLTFWLIVALWCQSDRAYDPEDLSITIIFQHLEARLLVYVPPGRERVVTIDLKSMSIIGPYDVVKNLETPKTRSGKPAKVMRLCVLGPLTFKGLLFEKNKKLNLQDSIGIAFNTKEMGALDLRSGFYFFLNNRGYY